MHTVINDTIGTGGCYSKFIRILICIDIEKFFNLFFITHVNLVLINLKHKIKYNKKKEIH